MSNKKEKIFNKHFFKLLIIFLIIIISTMSFISFVEEAIENNRKAVEDYKNGKENALNFLVGQVMRATRGKANPREISEIIKEMIDKEESL